MAKRGALAKLQAWLRRDRKGTLSPEYQRRLMRRGVTEEQHRDPSYRLSARGRVGKDVERLQTRILALLGELEDEGHVDRYGEPEVTLADIDELRQRASDEQIVEWLERKLRDGREWMDGRSPHENDPSYPGRKGNWGHGMAIFRYHGRLGS